jgi:hypothetical protein
MPREPQIRRTFTLSDAMVIVAATAVMFGLLRVFSGWPPYVNMSGGLRKYGDAPLAVRALLQAPWVVLPWTVALFVLRLRRPRPPLRLLTRQPGFVACGAVTLWLAFKTLWLGLTVGTPQPWYFYQVYLGNRAATIPSWAAPAVAGAWLLLASSGRWRPVPTWFDRTGRVLGTSWITLDALNALLLLF